MKSAEKSASEEIEAYRQEMQAQFDSKSHQDTGSSDEFQRQLDEETAAKLAQMRAAYEANSAAVVEMLVHYATTVPLQVPSELAACIKATNAVDSQQ